MECCDSVILSSTTTEFVDFYQHMLIGTWTKQTSEINDRPIYKKDNYIMAVGSSYREWVVTNVAGSNNGWAFGSDGAPKCPHSVSIWLYWDNIDKESVRDSNLKVTCTTRKYCLHHIFGSDRSVRRVVLEWS